MTMAHAKKKVVEFQISGIIKFSIGFQWCLIPVITKTYITHAWHAGVCLQKMELMEILWRQLKPNAFYAKKKDIIRSE